MRLPAMIAVPSTAVLLAASLAATPAGNASEVTRLSASSGASATHSAMARATQPAPRRAKYRAEITRTKHGIPHITARNWPSLGFGAGYAAAEVSGCTLLDTLITGRGERSRYFGADGSYDDQVTLNASNLQVDTVVSDLRDRRVVEKLMASKAGPGKQARAMVRGYAAGAGRYLAQHRKTFDDPACRGSAALKVKPVAKDVWYGVYVANLLASTGVFVKEIADAAPPSPTDPGLPQLPLRASAVDADALLRELGRDPERPFGSNATAIGGSATSTGKGMVLGNPHFPWIGRYRFTQQHLTIPGKYDVAGASLIGSPVVNIGWNKSVAWSHTVSTAYRFTPYEYRTVTPTTYVTDGGVKELEHRKVEIQVKEPGDGLSTVIEDVYRTDQGYVIDAPDKLMQWGTGSVWAIRDANAEHLRTIDTFLEMGKARNVRDLLRRQDRAGGMPWVNTTAADRKGNALYADHSVVPHVTDAMAEQCMTPVGRILNEVAGLPGLDGTRATSACAWGIDADAQRPGIFGNSHLPEVVRRDWVANANDSYWTPNDKVRLEGYPGIIGCEQCERTPRTKMVYRYVTDRLAKGKETPSSLARHQHENRVYMGMALRAGGDLAAVCAQAGNPAACAALAKWDGRSRTSSVGYHLVEEFVKRLPDNPWAVPFDPADPFNTPRDLNQNDPAVVQAMRDAIAYFAGRGIAFDATWASVQVAGDRGAPPIPLGGGSGDELGNANALGAYKPVQNADRYRAITYGSSHIQAIAFMAHGRVRARTILTYGQSENPRSSWSSDQTRLFSRGRWVSFPWTAKAIKRATVSSRVVSGR